MKKSITIKVLLPVFLLALVSIITAVLSMRNVRELQTYSNEISGTSIEQLTILNQVAGGFKDLETLAYQMCVSSSKADREQMLANADTMRADVLTGIDNYSATVQRDDEKMTLELLRTQYVSYGEVYDKVEEFISAGNKDKAKQVCNGELTAASTEVEKTLEQLQIYMEENVAGAVTAQQQVYESTIFENMLTFAGIAVILVIAIWISFRAVVAPIRKTTSQLDGIIKEIESGNGDLTRRISIKNKDEVGKLADGINVFLETLQRIMGQIVINSKDMGHVVSSVVSSVGTANSSACDISAVMEELSATMEEVSSSVTTVNDNVEEIENEVDKITQASKDMNTYASKMQDRAEDMKQKAVRNKENTSAMTAEIIDNLKVAIEESRSVERVNELTEEILNVSSQTNLLALNASIEAARAGEAGKGFAVVADEIRKLADSTRETANNIQSINGLVTAAVGKLADNSNAIVEYIDQNIMPDYDGFVETGVQYSEDATYVNATMDEFETKATNLNAIMQRTAESIRDIATAVEESANSVGNAANSTMVLVQNIDTVNSEMEMNQNISDKLKNEAERFKNV